MPRYYGTAIPQPPGHDDREGRGPVWAPVPSLGDEDWCEHETGCCPKRECEGCKKGKFNGKEK